MLRAYVILTGFAVASLGGFLTLYLYKWESRKNYFLITMIVDATAWVFACLLEVVLPRYEEKAFWYQAQYAFLICIPPLWLASTVHMSGMRKSRAAASTILTFGLAIALLAVFLTNGLHGIAFRSLSLSGDGTTIMKDAGPAYYFYLVYLFTSLFVGATTVIKGAIGGEVQRKRRAALTVVAISIPVLAGLADTFFPELMGSFEIAPIAALPTCIVLFFGAARYRFLDPVPLAKADLVERLADPVIVLDVSGPILYANARARALMGSGGGTRVGKDGLPEGEAAASVRVAVRSASTGDEIALAEREWAVAAEPVTSGKGEPVARIVSLRDVTSAREEAQRLEDMVAERTAGLAEANRSLADEVEKSRRSEAALKRSLEEKDLLLRELNHRVKNNLQVISSLLRLQSSRARDGDVREALEATQGRIKSISLVHERLYRGGSLGTVGASDYLRAIAEGIASLHEAEKRGIAVSVDADGIELDLDAAVNLGIMVNEAVNNAFKHVFDPGKGKRLAISLKRGGGGGLVLRVEDDGPGFSAEDGKAGLGLTIVNAVARQMGGKAAFGAPGSGVLEARISVEPAENGAGSGPGGTEGEIHVAQDRAGR